MEGGQIMSHNLGAFPFFLFVSSYVVNIQSCVPLCLNPETASSFGLHIQVYTPSRYLFIRFVRVLPPSERPCSYIICFYLYIYCLTAGRGTCEGSVLWLTACMNFLLGRMSTAYINIPLTLALYVHIIALLLVFIL